MEQNLSTTLAKPSIEGELQHAQTRQSPDECPWCDKKDEHGALCKAMIFLCEQAKKIGCGSFRIRFHFRVADCKIVRACFYWEPCKKQYGAPPWYPLPSTIILDEFTMYIVIMTAGPEWAKEELTLPPMLTESGFGNTAAEERKTIEERMPDLAQYDLSRLSNEAKRLYDLPKRAWSAIIYARENRVSSDEKDRLVHAFNEECNNAFKSASDFARLCMNDTLDNRHDFALGHWRWRQRVEDLLETELLDGFSSEYYTVVELELSWIELYKLGRKMALIEALHSNSGFFVSDFISITAEHESENKRAKTDSGSENKQEPVWSKPMSKSKMMTTLGLDSYKTFNAYAKNPRIREAGNRQTFQIRLDGMDKKTRSKLEKV